MSKFIVLEYVIFNISFLWDGRREYVPFHPPLLAAVRAKQVRAALAVGWCTRSVTRTTCDRESQPDSQTQRAKSYTCIS